MNYSLLHSRTFWTLVLMFAFDALTVYGTALPPQFLLLINAFLTTIAAYFHLQTGKSTTGTN